MYMHLLSVYMFLIQVDYFPVVNWVWILLLSVSVPVCVQSELTMTLLIFKLPFSFTDPPV